jgi:uncharacterized protein YndB with AHSA1/START domain
VGFPDRIERTVRIERPLDRVWTAITTAGGLGSWLGHSAEIDLRVGGTATLISETGDKAQLRVERIEPKTVFGYTWSINGLPGYDPRRTYVEFTLVPDENGTTVTVVESGFAQLEADDHRKALEGNTAGWAGKLDELASCLHA